MLRATWKRLTQIPFLEGEVESGHRTAFVDTGHGFGSLLPDTVRVTNMRIVISRPSVPIFVFVALIFFSIIGLVTASPALLIIVSIGWIVVFFKMRHVVRKFHPRGNLIGYTVVKGSSIFRRDQLVLSFALGSPWKLAAAGRGETSVDSIEEIFLGVVANNMPGSERPVSGMPDSDRGTVASPVSKALLLVVLLANWLFGLIVLNSFLYELSLDKSAPHSPDPATGHIVESIDHGVHLYFKQDDLDRIMQLRYVGFIGLAVFALILVLLSALRSKTSGRRYSIRQLPFGKWLPWVPIGLGACSLAYWQFPF